MLVLPTHTVGLETIESGATLFQQSLWSWGRVADTTPYAEPQFDFGNTVGLVLFALALAAGLGGSLAYAVRPGADGRILGAAGLAWAGAEVVGALGRRWGEAASGMYGETSHVETLPAGVLQVVSAVLLLVAVAVVVCRPVVGLVRSAVVRSRAMIRRHRTRADNSSAVAAGEPAAPRVGVATIRDIGSGERSRARRGAGLSPGDPRGVGFSDEPGADRDRFRPPR
jgi:hypothetical protein